MATVVLAMVVLAMVATVGVTAASALVYSRPTARPQGSERAAPTIAVADSPYEVAVPTDPLFTLSAAISGNTVVMGDPWLGRAYVFTKTAAGWK